MSTTHPLPNSLVKLKHCFHLLVEKRAIISIKSRRLAARKIEMKRNFVLAEK